MEISVAKLPNFSLDLPPCHFSGTPLSYLISMVSVLEGLILIWRKQSFF